MLIISNIQQYKIMNIKNQIYNPFGIYLKNMDWKNNISINFNLIIELGNISDIVLFNFVDCVAVLSNTSSKKYDDENNT